MDYLSESGIEEKKQDMDLIILSKKKIFFSGQMRL